MATIPVVRQIFILTILNSIISSTRSFLDIDEIQSTKYGIEIAGVPVLLKEDPELSNSIMVSSKHGQQYQCILPKPETKETVKESKKTFTTEEVSGLLKSLQNKCLHHNKGWWTYEFCYGKSVSQYHEEGNTIVGDKISLGIYSSQTDWDKLEVEFPYSKNRSKRFHSQFFENGTTCDLNGAQRTTEVKFKCEVDSQDHIAMVTEPSSCTYSMVIHTNKLCEHPLFKPAENRKPLAITCSPALPEERYQKYLKAVALEEKAKAKAIADKIRKRRAFDDQYDDEENDDYAQKPKKIKQSRSEVWPWDKPDSDADDETFISGDIGEKAIKVDRLDVLRGRKLREDGQADKMDESVMIRSRHLTQDRKPIKETVDVIDGKEESPDQEKSGNKDDVSSTKDNENNKESSSDNVKVTPRQFPLDRFLRFPTSQAVHSQEGDKTKEMIGEEGKQSGSPVVGKEKTSSKDKKKKSLEEEWHDALAQARKQLRTVVRKQLKSMGVDPDELENRFKATPGRKPSKSTKGEKQEDKQQSVAGSKTEGDPAIENVKGAVEKKIENVMQSVEQMEKDGTLGKNSKEKRLVTNIQKILKGMDLQNVVLMNKEETIQRQLEKHFDELKGRFNIEVEMMHRFIEEIEERGSHSGDIKDDDYLKTIVEKLKTSLSRFDKSNRALAADMEAVKELNKEIHSKIDDIVSANTAERNSKSLEFFRLTGKANLILRKLLQRSAQLDKEMLAMKEISDDIKARREEYADVMDDDVDMTQSKKSKKEAEQRLSFVIDKIKNMITDIDSGKDPTASDDEEIPDMKPASDNFHVRVSKIKGEDGKPVWTDGKEDELAENTGTGGELEIEEKLKRASKRMERMVKDQLENAGINPGGKVRVKIITSRDALENFGGKKTAGMDILSEEETSQFKKMILRLMGGSSEAGEEKKRQSKMENNYNLVWSEKGMKKAPPPEEDEPDAELVFDDTEFL